MEITWTAKVDGKRAPDLDATIVISEPMQPREPGPFIRALESEMRWLFTYDLPEAVVKFVADRLGTQR